MPPFLCAGRRALTLVSLALIAFSCSTDRSLTPITDGPLFSASGGEAQDASDRYLVRFEPENLPALDAQVGALGGTVVFSHKIGFAVVSGFTPDAAAELAAIDQVIEVQHDAVFELDPIVNVHAVEFAGDTPASPSDPTEADYFPWQWNLRAIEADVAWAAGRLGSPAVTLAILDTGIDYLYPDLAGLVDLSRSASFVASDDLLVSMYFPGRHAITDLHFHGTHVASTAVSHSNIIAGVTTQTTLIGVKVCSVAGTCPFSALISGVLYAADAGADVANMSLGGAFAKAGAGRYVGFISQVYNYANSAGMTIVVSAGNFMLDLDHDRNTYKTYCSTPNTMCISATGPTAGAGRDGPWTDVDAPAPYTNFGRSAISVAAPGGTNIPNSAGWIWAACSQTSLVIPICQTGNYVLGLIGTSQAAPHVSGLAALMVEDYGRNPGRIKSLIQKGADDLGFPGIDPYYGKGRVNVAALIN